MLKTFINVAKTPAGTIVLAIAAYAAIVAFGWGLSGWVLR